MNAPFINALASSAIAAAALLGAASPAHAIVYVGSFDPAFGAIFQNLGWRGSAEVVLPDACNGQTGTFLNLSDLACGSGNFLTQKAKVEFYALNDTNKATIETLNFGKIGTVQSVKLDTQGGDRTSTALTGVTTTYSYGIVGTSTEAMDNNKSFNFFLRFTDGVASMGYSLEKPNASRGSTPDKTAANKSDGPDANNGNWDKTVEPVSFECEVKDSKKCGVSSTLKKDIATVAFKQIPAVPEPETYALMLAGLGVLAFVAKRRKPV